MKDPGGNPLSVPVDCTDAWERTVDSVDPVDATVEPVVELGELDPLALELAVLLPRERDSEADEESSGLEEVF